MKDDRIHLIDMLEAARRIHQRTAKISRAEFNADENLQLALAYLLHILGEAARRVSAATRQTLPQIAWHQITGMRHRMVHEYSHVDFDVVWQTAGEDIPQLIAIMAPLVDPMIDQANSQKGKRLP
jgi:uncharacterized protein with HEPN domain